MVVALRLWDSFGQMHLPASDAKTRLLVQVVNTHKTKDTILGTSVRNIWFICALYNIDLSIEHIRSSLNVEANLLSRIHLDRAVNQKLQSATQK